MEPTESEKLHARIMALLKSEENRTSFDAEHGYEKVIAIYCNNHGITEPDINTLNDVEESYCGEWDSMRAFAENLVDDCGMLQDVPENFRNYFDYDAFSRDLVWSGDYWFHEDGYVFRSI
jgi:antirestriction protein